MAKEYFNGVVSLIPLDANAPKFFGFSEFLAGLALMVLAWTIADVRYRFRVRTAPFPLQGITFAVVGAVGVLTLLTDLWRAEQWLVPQGNLMSPSGWQALLGGLYLFTFLTWAWLAFIRPPIYGKRNAERYALTLYQFILKGSPSELAVIADEFALSVKSLIRYATDAGELKNYRIQKKEGDEPPKEPPKVTGYANDILLLIADKRFCRAIIESSPGTALAVFREVGETKKYGVQIEVFSKNILNEALANKNSFLFHEAEGYESGLIGYHKPLSQSMFSNHRMVETIGTFFDLNVLEMGKLEAAQWKAYCRVVLMTFRDYAEHENGRHSSILYGAMGNIEDAVFDLYKINGVIEGAWDDDVHDRLRIVVEFIKDAIEILNEQGVPPYLQLRVRENRAARTFYDRLADMFFKVICSAYNVRSPSDLCWSVQHNSVWSEMFSFGRDNRAAAKVVKFKVRRLIYDEVTRMSSFPNFKGAGIIGFCLNVMGLKIWEDNDHRFDSKALQKVILSWIKKNYAWLHSYNPRVAEACLVDRITYDAENLRLIMTSPIQGLRRKPEHFHFDVDPPSLEQEEMQGS